MPTIFKLKQADPAVYCMAGWIGSTDIGLAKLNATLRQKISRYRQLKANVRVASSQVQQLDQVYIDSYVTGSQFLMSIGVCVGQKAWAGLPLRQARKPTG